jgi:acyl carrier protein
MEKTRKLLIEALQKSTGFLNDAKVASKVLTGHDLPLDSLGLDSLTVMEAVMFLEDELEIELEIDIFNNVASLNELVKVIEKHVNASK